MSTPTSELIGRDLHYCITNGKGTRIACARVWNAEGFMTAQREAGMKSKDEADRYTVSLSTKAEYDAQKKAARK